MLSPKRDNCITTPSPKAQIRWKRTQKDELEAVGGYKETVSSGRTQRRAASLVHSRWLCQHSQDPRGLKPHNAQQGGGGRQEVPPLAEGLFITDSCQEKERVLFKGLAPDRLLVFQ